MLDVYFSMKHEHRKLLSSLIQMMAQTNFKSKNEQPNEIYPC